MTCLYLCRQLVHTHWLSLNGLWRFLSDARTEFHSPYYIAAKLKYLISTELATDMSIMQTLLPQNKAYELPNTAVDRGRL